jgi:hypothetical protein
MQQKVQKGVALKGAKRLNSANKVSQRGANKAAQTKPMQWHVGAFWALFWRFVGKFCWSFVGALLALLKLCRRFVGT